MQLEDVRRVLVRRRRSLDQAIDVIDQVLSGQPGGRREGSPELIQGLTARRRRQLLRALYGTGSTLEQLRLLSELSKRDLRQILGVAVDKRRTTLSDDVRYWNQQLDEGRSIAELAVAASSTTNTVYRHLRRLGVWPRPRESFERWLAKRTVAVGECQVWDPPLTDTQSVPMANRAGRSAVVRRLVWEHHHGPVDDELYVTAIRECAEPLLCVAEHHSRVLTPHQASLERSVTGRVAHGEEHGNARLTEDQAFAILTSPESTRQLAGRFGVSQATVHAIKTGRRWKHLQRDAAPPFSQPRRATLEEAADPRRLAMRQGQ